MPSALRGALRFRWRRQARPASAKIGTLTEEQILELRHLQSAWGTPALNRQCGRFLREQFHELGRLAVDCVYVAMFDEVDEGTAIFKVTSPSPAQGHFLGLFRGSLSSTVTAVLASLLAREMT